VGGVHRGGDEPARAPHYDRAVPSPALEGLAAAVATACGVPEPPRPSGAVDWSGFVGLLDRHRVTPLVHRSGWLAAAAAPAEVVSVVHERTRAAALRSLRLLELQREVLGALDEAGVAAVVLKGAAFGQDAHGDPAARAPGDVDVLVRPDTVTRAFHALRMAGFVWLGWPRADDHDRPEVQAVELERFARLPLRAEAELAKDGFRVELHWRLFPNPRLLPVDPGWLRRPRIVEMMGVPVPTLPLAAQWPYLLVHGSDHLWARMKWLADVPAFALRHPELARPAALAASARGNERSIATGLLTAEGVFGPFLTREARSWAAGVRGTRLLVRRSLAALADDEGPARHVTARAMAGEVMGRLALRRDARYAVEEARLLLLSAGRAQEVEDPGLAELALGPLRWVRRTARRVAPGARP
jgi:hypothetical protein